MPILWHIMMHYHTYGHREFAVALGYKGDHIKRWFAEYNSLNGSMTVNMATGRNQAAWELHPRLDGRPRRYRDQDGTGGRIKQLMKWMGNNTCMLTWGDGVFRRQPEQASCLSPFTRQARHDDWRSPPARYDN